MGATLLKRVGFFLGGLGLIVSLACSGGSSALPQASIPPPTLRIDSNVESPASESSNLSALSTAINSQPVSQVECSLYSLEGDLLGTASTDTNGDISFQVEIDDLKNSSETGTTWTVAVILECANGISLYQEVSVDEASSETADLGTADADSTLAALNVGLSISGWTGWGQNYLALDNGLNASCFNELHDALMQNADVYGDGLINDMAVMRKMIMGFMAAGGTLSEVGQTSWADFLKSVIGGTVSESTLELILQKAAGVDGEIDANAFTSLYAEAAQALQGLGAYLYSQIGASGQMGDLCTLLEAATLDPDDLILPLMVADDVDAFDEVFGDDTGNAFFIDLVEQCALGGDCSALQEKPGAFFGFMAGYEGDFQALGDVDSGFDDQVLEGALLIVDNCLGDSAQEIKDCGKAMRGTVEAYDGFANMQSDGSFDNDTFELWATYWKTQVDNGFDPDDVDEEYFEEVKDEIVPDLLGDSKEEIKECIGSVSGQSSSDFGSCFENVVPLCGDGTCDEFESNHNGACDLDCDYQALYCGDDVCDPTEAQNNGLCEADCNYDVLFPANDPSSDDPPSGDPSLALKEAVFNNASQGGCFLDDQFHIQEGQIAGNFHESTVLVALQAGGVQRQLILEDEGAGVCVAHMTNGSDPVINCGCAYELVEGFLRIHIECSEGLQCQTLMVEAQL